MAFDVIDSPTFPHYGWFTLNVRIRNATNSLIQYNAIVSFKLNNSIFYAKRQEMPKYMCSKAVADDQCERNPKTTDRH